MSQRPELGYFDEGIDLTSKESYLGAVGKLGVATILPLVAYRSIAFSHLEDEQIWTRDWICIGTLHDLEHAGDLLPYTAGYHGIHVRREADGGLIGAFNQAQHGGCRVIPEQCQGGVKTSCSFTSCGYSRDQQPISIGESEQSDAAKHQYLGLRPERLFPVRVATDGPLVFVNLDGAANDFRGLPKHISKSLVDKDVREGVKWTEYECNWKMLAYRLLGLDEDPSEEDDVIFGRSGEFAATWCFPNLLLLEDANSYCVVVVQPTALNKTLCRMECFTHKNSSKGGAESSLENWADILEARGRDSELYVSSLLARSRTVPAITHPQNELPVQSDFVGLWGQERLIERITAQARSDEELRLYGNVRNYLI